MDRTELLPSEERRLEVPRWLTEGNAWPAVRSLAPDGALWMHQVKALEALARGENIVAATSTASGKSLIFQAWTLDRAGRDNAGATAVFYPTKALANDQERRWLEACQQAGMPPGSVGSISGDTPMNRREAILRDAWILIMTPDVCHAWMTRRADSPDIQEFLKSLRNIIIDEAHIYEDVFGSNASYLFRRLITSATVAGNPAPPAFIAATATILDPGDHMRKLTGQDFTVITEEENGSPRFHREILHLPTSHLAGGMEDNTANLIESIIDNDPEAQVIAFIDHRQGVERIARRIGRDSVLPYRSGYQAQDRRDIEQKLQKNEIRAVIATSALELGIDMPDLNYGINADLPRSRKQLIQRMGRVGRSRPGTFIILAKEGRFAEYGETLGQYIRHQVEPSKLYLDNEYVAYQQALCMVSEMRAAGEECLSPPNGCAWPVNFEAALKNAHGRPPGYLAEVRQRSTEQPPHLAYGLRNSGEEQLEMVDVTDRKRPPKPIETIAVKTAIREAYPGAVYNHQRQPFTVRRWARRRETRTPFIEVTHAGRSRDRTKPLLRRVATTGLDQKGIVDGKLRERNNGRIALVNIDITESVEGFQDGTGRIQEYRDTEKHDPTKSRKQTRFPTTGVLLQIREPWFSGETGDPFAARYAVAGALRRHLAYRQSVALPDIGAVVDNLFIRNGMGNRLADDAVLIYDNIHGGLGLTADLWENIQEYAQRILQGAQEMEALSRKSNRQDGPRMPPDTALRLVRWLESVNEHPTADGEENPGPSCWWRIVRPQTQVSIFDEYDQSMTPGTVMEPRWDRKVTYVLNVQDKPVIAEEEAFSPPDSRHDWTLWQPSSGKMQEMSLMDP